MDSDKTAMKWRWSPEEGKSGLRAEGERPGLGPLLLLLLLLWTQWKVGRILLFVVAFMFVKCVFVRTKRVSYSVPGNEHQKDTLVSFCLFTSREIVTIPYPALLCLSEHLRDSGADPDAPWSSSVFPWGPISWESRCSRWGSSFPSGRKPFKENSHFFVSPRQDLGQGWTKRCCTLIQCHSFF